jgi:hypothetical protein
MRGRKYDRKKMANFRKDKTKGTWKEIVNVR